MNKHDNFLKEVVSFLKKLLVSRKQRCLSKTNNFHYRSFFLRLFSVLQELNDPYKKSNQSEMIFLTKVIIT